MTEWGVIGVLVVLVGLFATIIKPIINLNTTITKLTVTVEALNEDLKELTTKNSSTHERIFERFESDEKQLGDHERRISGLEKTR